MQTAEASGVLRIFFGCAIEADCVQRMFYEARERQKNGDVCAFLSARESSAKKERRARNMLRADDADPSVLREKNVRVLVVSNLAELCGEDDGAHAAAAKIAQLKEAGIDVYAALYLTQIRGVQDRIVDLCTERGGAMVDDELFDEADEIRFVERPPRFTDTRAEAARLEFLREAALRRMAERMDRRRDQSAGDHFEHVLVCLSPSPSNERVLRGAARLARSLGARFTALYVETQRIVGRTARVRLQENVSYARQMGATIVNVYGADVPLQIAEYAKIARVTKIILGRASSPFYGGTAHRILEYAPDIELYLIPDEPTAPRPALSIGKGKPRVHLTDVAFAAGVMVLCTLVGMVMDRMHLSLMNIAAVYMLGVVAVAWRFSHPLLSLLSVIPAYLCLNTYFNVPRIRAGRVPPESLAILLILTTAAFITGTVMDRSNRLASASAKNAYNTSVLLSAGQTMYAAGSLEDIARAAMRSVQNLLGCAMVFAYPGADGKFVYESIDEGGRPLSAQRLNFTECSAAKYAFEHNAPAGRNTQKFRYADAQYVPLADSDGVNAVIGMFGDMDISRTDTSLLDSLLMQISFVLEKYQTDKKREAAALAAENEAMRANLLRAISHDLRTPLTGILGSAGLLMGPLEENVRQELVQDIYQDAQWLVNLVENVLSVTRMEDGRLSINLTPQIIDEIVDEALTHVMSKKTVKRESDGELLIARADAQLLTQVIVNLVNNAYGHGGENVNVCVRTYKEGDFAVIQVADDGVGVPDEAKQKIFDLFYTTDVTGDSRKGLGVGLALCRSIIRAHGGTIDVTDASPHGAVFTIRLAAVNVEAQEG